MGQPRPSYSEILAEVGKAWDLENNDAGMAITLLDQLKSTIQGNSMDFEKRRLSGSPSSEFGCISFI